MRVTLSSLSIVCWCWVQWKHQHCLAKLAAAWFWAPPTHRWILHHTVQSDTRAGHLWAKKCIIVCIYFHQESAEKQLVFGVGIFMEHLANNFQFLPFNTFFVPYVLPYLSELLFLTEMLNLCILNLTILGKERGGNDGFFSFVLIYR